MAVEEQSLRGVVDVVSSLPIVIFQWCWMYDEPALPTITRKQKIVGDFGFRVSRGMELNDISRRRLKNNRHRKSRVRSRK